MSLKLYYEEEFDPQNICEEDFDFYKKEFDSQPETLLLSLKVFYDEVFKP